MTAKKVESSFDVQGALHMIALGKIGFEADFNYRKGDLPEIPSLAKSIKLVGLLDPFVVRPNHEDEGHFLVVDGHRRYAALLTFADPHMLVPCIVREDAKDRKIVGLALHTGHVPPHAADLAVRLAELATEEGLTNKDLAAKLSLKSHSNVGNLIRAARSLSAESLAAWKDRDLPNRLIFRISAMNVDEQAEAIAEYEKTQREENSEGSEPDADEGSGGGDDETEGGSANGPSAKEMRAKLEALESRETLTEVQIGMRRTLKWVLGMTTRI
jgi:ParB/RepB/Spo0J family partition protein